MQERIALKRINPSWDRRPIPGIDQRTVDIPFQADRGYSISERRLVQIENLRYRLAHIEEFCFTPRKIARMEASLAQQEVAQAAYGDKSKRERKKLTSTSFETPLLPDD